MKKYESGPNRAVASVLSLVLLAESIPAWSMDFFRSGNGSKPSIKTRLKPSRRQNQLGMGKDVLFAENAKFQLKSKSQLHPVFVIQAANEWIRSGQELVQNTDEYLTRMNNLDTQLKQRMDVAQGVSNYNPLESVESKLVKDSLSVLTELVSTGGNSSNAFQGGSFLQSVAGAAMTFMSLNSKTYDAVIGPLDQKAAQLGLYSDYRSFEAKSTEALTDMRKLAFENPEYSNALRVYLSQYQIDLDASETEILDPLRNPVFASAFNIQGIREALENQSVELSQTDATRIVNILSAEIAGIVKEGVGGVLKEMNQVAVVDSNASSLASSPRESRVASQNPYQEPMEILKANAQRLEGVKSVAFVLKTLVGAENVETIQKFEKVAETGLQISSAIQKFNMNLGDPKKGGFLDQIVSGAVLSGDVLSIGLNLIGALFGGGPDEKMQELHKIREDLSQVKGMISELGDVVLEVGQKLDAKLNFMLEFQDGRFNHVDSQLEKIIKNQIEMATQMKEIAEKLGALVIRESAEAKRELKAISESLGRLHEENEVMRSGISSSISIFLNSHEELSKLLVGKDLAFCLGADRLFGSVRISEEKFTECLYMVQAWMNTSAGTLPWAAIQGAKSDSLWTLMKEALPAQRQQVALAKAAEFLGRDNLRISNPTRWAQGANLITNLFLKNRHLMPRIQLHGLFGGSEEAIFTGLNRDLSDFREFLNELKTKNYLRHLTDKYRQEVLNLRTALLERISAIDQVTPLNESLEYLIHPWLGDASTVHEAETDGLGTTLSEFSELGFMMLQMIRSFEEGRYLSIVADDPSLQERQKWEIFSKLSEGYRHGIFQEQLDRISTLQVLLTETAYFLYPQSARSGGPLSQFTNGMFKIFDETDIKQLIFNDKPAEPSRIQSADQIHLRVLLAENSENDTYSLTFPVRSMMSFLEKTGMTSPEYVELEPFFEYSVARLIYIQRILGRLNLANIE